MKKVLLAGVALLALTVGGHAADVGRVVRPAVTAPVLPPDFSGVFGIYGGAGIIEDGDDWYKILGVNGAVNMSLGGSLGLQVSSFGEVGLESDSDTYGGVQTEAHLYMRDPNRYALGLVGAVAFDQDDDDWNIHGLIGAEGALYLGPTTLGLQGGYVGNISTEGNDRLVNALFVRGIAQFFVNPNLKLQVTGAYLNGKFDSDSDSFHGFQAGGEIAWKFSRMASVFGAVDGMWHTDDTWGGNFQTYQVTAGLRFHFNQGTLLSENRTGASFDTLNIVRTNSILARNN